MSPYVMQGQPHVLLPKCFDYAEALFDQAADVVQL